MGKAKKSGSVVDHDSGTAAAPDYSTQDLLLKAELALTLLKKTQNHLEFTGFEDHASEFMSELKEVLQPLRDQK